MNQEFPGVQAGFRKCRETRDQIVSIHWIIEKAKEQQNQIVNVCWIIEKASEFQKDTCCFINFSKFFDCVDDNKLENS